LKILKNKNFWQIIIIIVIILISAILLFFPKLINHKYKYSYESIVHKKEEVNSLNDILIYNEDEINASIDKLEIMEEESYLSKQRADNVRKGINESDFKLHMPSIIISLEQVAIENGIKLSINYNSITSSLSSVIDDVNEMDYKKNLDESLIESEDSDVTIEHEEEYDGEEIDKKEKEVEEKEVDEKNNQESVDFSTSINTNNLIPSIEGINVTVIPIEVSGSYYNVRNYIKYLDKIGMIEPSSINLESRWIEEDELTMKSELFGQITLNVFHGEV